VAAVLAEVKRFGLAGGRPAWEERLEIRKRRQDMRIWGIVLVGAVATYGVVAGGIYAMQRAILFHQNTNYLEPQAVPQLPPGVEEVKLKTSDNELIIAWYRAPQPGKRTILFFPGNAGHLPYMVDRFRGTAREGLGLMALAYRGYSGSTGSPSEEGLMIDAATAYDWLAAKTPADQIIIHGAALGSTVAAKLAAEKPARELVLEAPYPSALSVMASRFWFLPIRLLMKDPFRAEEALGKLKMPVLVVHGAGDEVVPLHRAEAVMALVPEPKKLVSIPKGSHNNLSELGLYKEIAAFADAAVKP
jgi:uncharacterized protein